MKLLFYLVILLCITMGLLKRSLTCFKCKEIIPTKFLKKENLPFCSEKCLRSMVCDKCDTIVRKDMLFVGQLQLHPTCFVCMKCGRAFKDEYAEYRGQPYCEPCMAGIEIV